MRLREMNGKHSALRARTGSARRRGMTMLEVTVAMTVLLLTIGGALSTQLASQRLTATGQETNMAMADLTACMEELLLLPTEEIPVAGSEFAADEAIADFEELHLTGQRIVATYPNWGGGAVADPLEIVLTCSWRDHGGRTRTLQLASMKTR